MYILVLKYLVLDWSWVFQIDQLRHNLICKFMYGNDIELYVFVRQVEYIFLLHARNHPLLTDYGLKKGFV
jgi:hypothetical protein